MKIEKINENKIRVTLSANDLAERNLDFQSLRYNSPEAQTLFLDMMKKAELEHGFSAANCQLFVEAASVMNGNFIVTITKMTDYQKNILSKSKLNPAGLHVKRKSVSNNTLCIINFSSFDTLIDAVSVSALPQNIASYLYQYKSSYYLVLKPTLPQTKSMKKLVMSLSEFGEIVYDPYYMEAVLKEYGKKVINKSAIKTLSASK